MEMQEQRCRLALSCVEGIGPVKYRLLLSACGSAEALFRMRLRELKQLPGMHERTASAIHRFSDWDRLDREMTYCAKAGIEVLFMGEPNYPAKLMHCEDAPPVLFFKGKGNPNAVRTVAVIGTRRATEYGRQLCEALVVGLRDHNITVLSGLAYGIDITAHKACVQQGVPTIGVLAHGLASVYPPEHTATATAMQAQGGLLSTHFHDVTAERGHFPARNRIVAGMADVVVLVETGAKGGSLITARFAEGYHRELCCFPARVNDAQSAGCLSLIKTLKASLICSASDLLFHMQWEKDNVKQLPLFETLPPEEQQLWEIVREYSPIWLDDLQLRSAWTTPRLMAVLMLWELQGRIYWMPGKRVALR